MLTATLTVTATLTETTSGAATSTPTLTATATATETATATMTETVAGTPTEAPPTPFESAYYTYDGDDNMVMSVINGITTYYPSSSYVVEVDGSDTTVRKTYTAGNTSLAVRTIVNSTENTLNWMLSDHLGSSSITTAADGTWNSELRYSAFGETRYSSGLTPTNYRYTGQLEQKDVNLYYYNARYYDAALGRFVQADTILPSAGDAKSYDRYAYVNNNPIIYTDPSGHCYVVDENGNLTDRCKNRWRQYTIKMSASISTDILFSGSQGEGSAHEPGPPPEEQMGVWVKTGDYEETQQYLGSDYYYDATGVKHYRQPYAKYATADEAYHRFSNLQMVSLTCYSGGVEACLMFAEMYIDGGGQIFTISLIGGGYLAGNEEGIEKGFDYWSDRVQALVNAGVHVLVYDDLVYGGLHHGDLGVEAGEKGSYDYIQAERMHWHKSNVEASNNNVDLADRISNWHNTVWFDLLPGESRP